MTIAQETDSSTHSLPFHSMYFENHHMMVCGDQNHRHPNCRHQNLRLAVHSYFHRHCVLIACSMKYCHHFHHSFYCDSCFFSSFFSFSFFVNMMKVMTVCIAIIICAVPLRAL